MRPSFKQHSRPPSRPRNGSHGPSTPSSWENVNQWYSDITGVKGHYFHQHVIFPKLFSGNPVSQSDWVLDLGCGDGVLERQLPKEVEYLGIDVSESLVKAARLKATSHKHHFVMKNVTRPLQLKPEWSKIYCILALQNMKDPVGVFDNIASALKPKGSAFIVMNHPAFRIPRQSSWGIDERNKLQYRKVNRYLSPIEIPITMNPGTKSHEGSKLTWSYHFPISYYANLAKEKGLVIADLQEWTSDKKSEGRAAKSENRAREEIPVFLTLVLKKA